MCSFIYGGNANNFHLTNHIYTNICIDLIDPNQKVEFSAEMSRIEYQIEKVYIHYIRLCEKGPMSM